MSNLKNLIRAVQQDLPITVRHERWLGKNSNPVYSDEAVAFAKRALAGEFQQRKRMMFRASGVGDCTRRRMFAALGMPEMKIQDTKLSNIFHTGNFLHLKWQMAGLTEGWLTKAEVALDKIHLNFGGTLDGVLYDGTGFEFKTINSFGHLGTYRDPKSQHIRQVHSYMYLGGLEKFSVIYENKDSGEWREMRVERDPALIKEIDKEIGDLNESYEKRKLPQVLPDCQRQEGAVYRNCPFKDRCLGIKNWPTILDTK